VKFNAELGKTDRSLAGKNAISHKNFIDTEIVSDRSVPLFRKAKNAPNYIAFSMDYKKDATWF